jgi:hypothetical protein
MYRLSSLAALVALSVSVPCFADICGGVAGNLVTNCGFETGSLSGWNTSNLNATLVATAGFDNLSPNSGIHFAALGNVGSDGIMSQTLATVIGQSYNISFYFASDGGLPNDFSASFGSDLLYSNANVPASGYQLFSFTDTATSTSTVLSFAERNDPSYQALDDVSVTLAGLQNFPSQINTGLTVAGGGFTANCFPAGSLCDPSVGISLRGHSTDINGAFTFAADANGNINSEFVDPVTGINDIYIQTPLDPAQLINGYGCSSTGADGGVLFPACGFRIDPTNPALLDILFDGPDVIPVNTHFTISGDGWVLPVPGVAPSSVPEPGSWVLLLTVAGVLIARQRFVGRSRS